MGVDNNEEDDDDGDEDDDDESLTGSLWIAMWSHAHSENNKDTHNSGRWMPDESEVVTGAQVPPPFANTIARASQTGEAVFRERLDGKISAGLLAKILSTAQQQQRRESWTRFDHKAKRDCKQSKGEEEESGHRNSMTRRTSGCVFVKEKNKI